MFCPKCGTPVENGSRFCSACGTDMLAGQAAATAAAEAAEPAVKPAPEPPPAAPNPSPAPAADTVPTPPAPAAPQPPVYTQPPAAQQPYSFAPQAPAAVTQKPLSVGAYIGIFLLSGIPIVSLIVMIIWAVGAKNKSLRHYAVAWIILVAIGVVAGVVLSILFGAQLLALYNNSQSLISP